MTLATVHRASRDQDPSLPVELIPGDGQREPEDGIALCLSGGGFRAMLFHLGALTRLNELGYLPKLDRVSSVSGGSITAGVLALQWAELAFDAQGVATQLEARVAAPLRALSEHTLDVTAVVGGALLPGNAADRVAAAYRDHLFGRATLQALPDRPRFVFNATNTQTGALWRFSKPYMADYRIGMIPSPEVELAIAVAASSAFPPFLSPLTLELDPASFAPGDSGDLFTPPFTQRAVLTDGGVYDNLGLETAFKRYRTLLVSDGGATLAAEPDPKDDWPRHTYRVLNLINSQVSALRKRQLIGAFEAGVRRGAYWGIRSDVASYGLADPIDFPVEEARAAACTPTRLKKLEVAERERIERWGYVICDAAVRRWGV